MLSNSQKLLVLALATGVPGLAHASPPDVTDPPDSSEVTGGQEAEPCAWPTTVALTVAEGLCSGTLVHPQIVIYAAHCGDEVDKVRFGEKADMPSKTQAVDFCMTNPSFGGGGGQAVDSAFCKLKAPVPMAVTPVIYGCETSMLSSGREVAVAGFGHNTASNTGAGTKRWAMTQINNVSPGILEIGGGGTGVCQGDSGGPAFLQYDDGTWHTVGITSTGLCGSSAQFGRIDGITPWVEEASGIDITPCHDVDGTWNPTPQCQRFFAGGGTGYGAWSAWCDETPLGGSSDTCGDPFDAIPDSDPPTVTITSPDNGTVYDSTSETIDIEIDADDGDGWGVKQIALEINGEIQPLVDEAEPWALSGVTFPEGQWTLVAIATDWADNEGRSQGVGIGVGEEAPDPPDPGDDGGAGDGGDDGDDGSDGDGDDSDGGDDGGYPPGMPGADRTDDREGCGCATAKGSPLASALLLLAMGFWRRRLG